MTFLTLFQVSGTGWTSAYPEPSSLAPRSEETPPASSEGSLGDCHRLLSWGSGACCETRLQGAQSRVPSAEQELVFVRDRNGNVHTHTHRSGGYTASSYRGRKRLSTCTFNLVQFCTDWTFIMSICFIIRK